MSNNYFSNYRLDIQQYIVGNPCSILELGCANGLMGNDLKKKYNLLFYTGVDYNIDALKNAEKNLDKVIHFDFNKDNIENFFKLIENKYDYIICSDVLEHLINPLDLLEKLKNNLNENGKIIISIPNIMHISVIYNLLFKMDFPYTESGILDKTHLKFFTEKSFKRELNKLSLYNINTHYQNGYKSKILSYIFGKKILNYFTRQIIYIIQK